MDATAICNHCRKRFMRAAGALNRAMRAGSPLFCSMKCSGMSRRSTKPKAQKRADKAAYDKRRREELHEELCAKKRAAYYANHEANLAKFSAKRKERMPAHVEYCRRPQYRAKKSDYDKKIRADEYGDFAETYLLLLEVEKEIRSRATSYERRVANGYYTRSAQARRRAIWQSNRKNLPQAI